MLTGVAAVFFLRYCYVTLPKIFKPRISIFAVQVCYKNYTLICLLFETELRTKLCIFSAAGAVSLVNSLTLLYSNEYQKQDGTTSRKSDSQLVNPRLLRVFACTHTDECVLSSAEHRSCVLSGLHAAEYVARSAVRLRLNTASRLLAPP